ncbi:hypothetical protein TCDM_10325 [Trypanosoma cruzi Dm28c]|uniref:Sialidase domain-containing protein n=1 Tax=Trypanosoma cruzi Dm28c TaxID=1416333 RepID=V5B3A0_TRYCR|nr:hypothetical protein TCDM_10325 [Trypanosoma cruzi Dm28c]
MLSYLQGVDLFVPQTTLMQPKEGIVPVTARDSFVSPSLVCAGGVIAAFFEGCMDAEYQCAQLCPFLLMLLRSTSTLCGIGPLLLVRSIKDTLRAHNVLGAAEGKESLGVVLRRTTITKGNGMFPHAGGFDVSYEGGCWREGGLEPKLVVGDVTNPTGDKQSGRIEWGGPKLLSKRISSASHEGDWTEFIASGGAGVVMEDGTLVFSLMAKIEAEDVYSMIVYSTDNGSAWGLCEDISLWNALTPRHRVGGISSHDCWLREWPEGVRVA